MEDRIVEELRRTEFVSQEEVRRHVAEVQAHIQEYEQDLYESNRYNAEERAKIRKWRLGLYNTVRSRASVPENTEALEELESTARLVHRQVQKADANQRLLDKSTLKLMGLNYTNRDIERKLEEARRRIRENKKRERTEWLMIAVAAVVFIFVCILILFEKFVTRG
jgi:hypothetical protein